MILCAALVVWYVLYQGRRLNDSISMYESLMREVHNDYVTVRYHSSEVGKFNEIRTELQEQLDVYRAQTVAEYADNTKLRHELADIKAAYESKAMEYHIVLKQLNGTSEWISNLQKMNHELVKMIDVHREIANKRLLKIKSLRNKK